jgi:hypothetical protein
LCAQVRSVREILACRTFALETQPRGRDRPLLAGCHAHAVCHGRARAFWPGPCGWELPLSSPRDETEFGRHRLQRGCVSILMNTGSDTRFESTLAERGRRRITRKSCRRCRDARSGQKSTGVASGTRRQKIAVKVVDIVGNDTMTIVEVGVGKNGNK